MKQNIQEIVSFCGIICVGCPIYWATWEENEDRKNKMKTVIAKRFNEQFDTDFGPEDMTDCEGCRTKNGKLFSGSRKCEIRKCAILRGFKNCALCPDYPCEILEEVFESDPSAQARLDVIKSSEEI